MVNPETHNQNEDGLTLVLMRNSFYRDNYRAVVLAVGVVFFINLILVITIIHRYLNPPSPQYFPTNSQYQLIKWHPLNEPVVDNNFVLQWVTDAVRAAFSLDFMHWREQLQTASNNFTPSGWHWFLSAFNKSGNLDTLVKLKMVSNVTITGAPQMQYQGVLGDRYIWKVEMPILITFTNNEKTIPLPFKVTLIVERVSVQDNPDLIEINEFLPVVGG